MKYNIKLKGRLDLWGLSDDLNDAYYEDNDDIFGSYNKELKQYGLFHDSFGHYHIIDEDLFSLFLLEYSDKVIIEEYHE